MSKPESASPPDTRHDSTIATVASKEKEVEKKLETRKALRALLEHGRLLLQMVVDYVKGRYREVPYWAIGAGSLALLYVLSPIDAIPDLIPGLGYLDDATILAFCLKLVEVELDKYREWRKTREAEVVADPEKKP